MGSSKVMFLKMIYKTPIFVCFCFLCSVLFFLFCLFVFLFTILKDFYSFRLLFRKFIIPKQYSNMLWNRPFGLKKKTNMRNKQINLRTIDRLEF